RLNEGKKHVIDFIFSLTTYLQ
ncbi:MAG: hypothetical protein JWR15_720, partial [Prosthecobacter sp.]|nr:hypothetical protein [Prosthecobacter sp.]